MSDWNPKQYLKFEAQRTQPSLDLAVRLRRYAPKSILDLGCGPGNSTAVLREVFPDAALCGLDSSQNMIDKARAAHPALSFRLGDVQALEGNYDLLFSNACLQWLPDHRRLLPHLMHSLNDGGVLAVQIPMNPDEPLFRIIRQTAADPKWELKNVFFEVNETLESRDYFDILAGCASDFEIWETVYHHRMPSHAALLDWVRSTRLRPYLDALDEAAGAQFEAEILEAAKRASQSCRTGKSISASAAFSSSPSNKAKGRAAGFPRAARPFCSIYAPSVVCAALCSRRIQRSSHLNRA